MNRAARLSSILDLIAEHGEVEVDDLVHRLDASPATIRRDLDRLAQERLLTRTHGGAVAQSLSYELPIRYKSHQRSAEKAKIARAAAALVAPGAAVGLSGGTTTTAIAAALAARSDLAERGMTVITNAINIAAQLATRPEFKVVVTGGVINPRSYELVGAYASRILDLVQIDIAFIGVNGIDATGVASTPDEREAEADRRMAARADRAIIVADSSKLGVRSFASIGGAELFDAVLTDDGADPAATGNLATAGYEVVLAD